MGEFAFYARALWAVCWEQAKHNDRQEMDSPKVAREQALFSAPLDGALARLVLKAGNVLYSPVYPQCLA